MPKLPKFLSKAVPDAVERKLGFKPTKSKEPPSTDMQFRRMMQDKGYGGMGEPTKHTHAAGGGVPMAEDFEKERGPGQWYDEQSEGLRRSTAAGMLRELETLMGVPPAELIFNDPEQMRWDAISGGGARAFQGRRYDDKYRPHNVINLPTGEAGGGPGGGYWDTPQGLAQVLAHEVAHTADQPNVMDMLKSGFDPNRVGHTPMTFRPLEKKSLANTQTLPEYFPGEDYGTGGTNEYADIYRKLGDYVQQFQAGRDPENPTRLLSKPFGREDLLAQLANALQEQYKPDRQIGAGRLGANLL